MAEEDIIDKFIATKNAYFYNKLNQLSSSIIRRLFTDVSAERDGHYLVNFINKSESIDGNDVKISMCLFKLRKNPPFLSEPLEDVKETAHGYVIIVDYSSSVVIFKKNVSGVEKILSNHISRFDYKIISRAFIDSDTTFEKFSTSNMNTADNAIRNSNLEAVNLRNIISRFGASKKILNSMRIDNSGTRQSMALNTARVNSLEDKAHLLQLYAWCVNVVDVLENYRDRPAYIDIFSTPIVFKEYIDSIIPTNVLFKFSKLRDAFDNGDIIDQFQLGENDERIQIDINVIISSSFQLLCDLSVDSEDVSGSKFLIDNEFDPDMRLNILSQSISIKSPLLKSIFIELSGGAILHLERYLNAYCDFIVNFDDPEIVYANRKLFKDHKLLSDIDGFMSVFEPIPILTNCNSEKGTFTNTQTRFSPNSLFRIIEDNIAVDSEYLFCDDLGNEWADYIGIHQEKITFYHAKHKAATAMSASNFQDVVGQALKNLGSFEPSDSDLDSKQSDKWSLTYNNDNSQTSIPRYRGEGSMGEAVNRYKFINSRPNRRKEVVLVIDFISYNELQTNLNLLKDGEEFARRKETLQILWQISSLVANCTEQGIEIRITCVP